MVPQGDLWDLPAAPLSEVTVFTGVEGSEGGARRPSCLLPFSPPLFIVTFSTRTLLGSVGGPGGVEHDAQGVGALGET